MKKRKKRRFETVPAKSYIRVPSPLIGLRHGVTYESIARFYGNYITMRGTRKRFSFSVDIESGLSKATVGKLMRITVNNLLNNKIPKHKQGDVFSGFSELLFGTPWVQVKRLVQYKAGVHYER